MLNFSCWIQCNGIWITIFYISPHCCNRLLSLHQRDFLFSVAAPVMWGACRVYVFPCFFPRFSSFVFFPPYMPSLFFCVGHDLLLFQAVKPAETFSGLIEINLTWLRHALHTQGDTHKHTHSVTYSWLTHRAGFHVKRCPWCRIWRLYCPLQEVRDTEFDLSGLITPKFL